MDINLNLNTSLLKMLKGLNNEEITKIIADSVITEDELTTLSKVKDIDNKVVLCAKTVAQHGTTDATKNNELYDSLNTFFSDAKVQKIIDSNGDGTIGDKELTTYLTSIQGMDNDNGSLSITDLKMALAAVNQNTQPILDTDVDDDDKGDPKLKENLVDANEKLKTAWGELVNAETEMNTAISKEIQNNQELAQYKDQYTQTETAITAANEGITTTTDQIDKKNIAIDAQAGEIETTAGAIVINQQAQTTKTNEMEGIASQIDGLGTQTTSLSNDTTKDKDGNTVKANHTNEIARIGREIDRLEKQYLIKQQNLDSLVQKQGELEEKKSDEEFKLQVLQSELQDLQTERDGYYADRDTATGERETILAGILKCETVSAETKTVIENYQGLESTFDSTKKTFDTAEKAYDASINLDYLAPDQRAAKKETAEI